MLFISKGLPILIFFSTCLYIIVTLVVYHIVQKSNRNERINNAAHLVEDNWHFDHHEPNQQIKRNELSKIRMRPPKKTPESLIDRRHHSGHKMSKADEMRQKERERFMSDYQKDEEIQLEGDVHYEHYKKIRKRYDEIFPSPLENQQRLLDLAQSLRKRTYQTMNGMPYDIYNCPETPPEGYPYTWKIYDDIVTHWNPDISTPPDITIYQGLCMFDYKTEYDKAQTYREAELPFILRNDPNILSIVERWNHPNYLSDLLGSTETYKSEYSTTNHFMFWRLGRGRPPPNGWKSPTDVEYDITFTDWLDKARRAKGTLKTSQEHVYFRLNGCKDSYKLQQCLSRNGPGSYYIGQEIPFFSQKKSFYIVEPDEFRGINCRFGMNGIIAENHFDGSRNMIILLGGERRYILAHPDQCPNLELYPKGHPSGRHSSVDWSDPDFEKHPRFRSAMGNEVVMQAGDLLYLPTFWFHYIISLDEVNYQCNARSGITNENSDTIRECGF